jgi:demethylmenaquinone methyltransferase/2-methoxy-6-polyprenyl-1,4-benzoquinol methylase
MPTAPPPPAWDDELLQNPHTVADKRRRVQQMFAAIVPRYDLNNRLHSFGRDQAWRRKAVKLAQLKPTDVVVDVACGTGDLTLAMTHALWPEPGDWPPAKGQVVGIDFTFAMLPRARAKAMSLVEARTGAGKALTTNDHIAWVNGDAQALPLPDGCADVVSIAFGIRNVQDVTAALREFYRVLRPGGRMIILEFSRPRNRVIRFFNDLYCAKIMPHTATWISGDKSGAYKYLPMSVKSFIDREQMTAMMRDVGFGQIEQFPMTFGVCVCYRGVKVK